MAEIHFNASFAAFLYSETSAERLPTMTAAASWDLFKSEKDARRFAWLGCTIRLHRGPGWNESLLGLERYKRFLSMFKFCSETALIYLQLLISRIESLVLVSIRVQLAACIR